MFRDLRSCVLMILIPVATVVARPALARNVRSMDTWLGVSVLAQGTPGAGAITADGKSIRQEQHVDGPGSYAERWVITTTPTPVK